MYFQEALKKELDRELLPHSLIRDELHHLDAFVFGNSNRKIMSNWLVIEAKFSTSTITKSFTMRNPQTGLTYTVTPKAMSLSTLTGLLCSTRVKIKHTELSGLFQTFSEFGMEVTEQEIFYCRCLAAARALLSHAMFAGQHLDEVIEHEIIKITTEHPSLEEKIFTLDELRDVVFAKDPIQRANQMQAVDKQRESMVQEHLEEKKRKIEANERVELRKAKAIHDFKGYLREIQFSKGVITYNRLDSLHQIINTCHKLIAEMENVAECKFPQDLVDLLGIECFPLHTRKSLMQVKAPLKTPIVRASSTFLDASGSSKVKKQRIGYEGEARIPLAGHPTLLQIIKLTVSYGRGLRGFSYRDVVELLQAYCSTRIQSFTRAYLRRYRFRMARQRWRKIFGEVKRIHFTLWKVESQAQVAMRRYCWRKLKVWRQYRVKSEWRRMLFRVCFWPFYVWRRYAQKLATAREKARFLCGRVIPTVWKLKCYRAWKKHVHYTVELRTRANNHYRGVLMVKARSLMHFLNGWAHQNKLLRKSWFKEGMMRLKKSIYKAKNVPFQIWRSYVHYKKAATARAKLFAPYFFRALFPLVAFRTPINRMDRKKRMRVLWIRNEREEKKRKKERDEAFEKQRKQERADRKQGIPSGSSSSSMTPGTAQGSLASAGNNSKPGSPEAKPGRSSSAAAAASAGTGTAGTANAAAVLGGVAPGSQVFPEGEEESDEYVCFDWGVDVSLANIVDVPDEEPKPEDYDDIEPPDTANHVYETQITPIFHVQDLPFLAFSDLGIQTDVDGLRDGMMEAERWQLIESGFRFQKFARRALYHLRDYAHIRRNARKSIEELNERRKVMVFHALYIWMKKVNDVAPVQGDEGSATMSAMTVDINDQTDAERLSNLVRNSRLHRMLRRRAAINDMKELGVVDESEAEVDALMQPPKKGMNEALRIATALYSGPVVKKKNVVTAAMLMQGMAAPSVSTGALVAPEPPPPSMSAQRSMIDSGGSADDLSGADSAGADGIIFIDNNHETTDGPPSSTPPPHDLNEVSCITEGVDGDDQVFPTDRRFSPIGSSAGTGLNDGTGVGGNGVSIAPLDADMQRLMDSSLASPLRSPDAVQVPLSATGAETRPMTGVSPRRDGEGDEQKHHHYGSRPSTSGLGHGHSSRPGTGDYGRGHSSHGSRPSTGDHGHAHGHSVHGSRPSTSEHHHHHSVGAHGHGHAHSHGYGHAHAQHTHGHSSHSHGHVDHSRPGTGDHVHNTQDQSVHGRSSPSANVVAAQSPHGHHHGHSHSGHGGGYSAHSSPSKSRPGTRGHSPSRRKSPSRSKREIEGIKRSINKKEILGWDKEDRLSMVAQAEEMCKLSAKLLEDAKAIVQTAEEATAAAAVVKKTEAAVLVDILHSEGAITKLAVGNELEYVSNFKVHAADNLVTVLTKINREIQLELLKAETKKYFRALRGPLSEKLSLMMYNRKKLANYIRLCKRLIAINRKMPRFRRLKTMWIIFNRWLKLVESEQMNVTPGLIPSVKRTCQLLPGYSNLLASKGITEIVYVSSVKLSNASSDFGATFLRWQMCVQETKIFTLLEQKAAELDRLMTMYKVFYAFRFHLRHSDSLEKRKQTIGFPIIRVKTDLDQITKRFISLRRMGLQFVVGNYNRKFVAYTVQDARSSLSFKRFLRSYKAAVSLRLTTEQRVLSESFEHRGQQEFIDVRAPKSLPNSMSRLDGKRFADPYISNDDNGKGCWVPAGYRLSILRLNMQEGVGIVGWQVVWSADTAKEIQSRKRGKWNGAAMNIHELHVPEGDFCQGVEYLYDASSIVGLRLRFVWGGWSKWVGGKTSMSTLPLYLNANMSQRMQFEDEYTPAGDDEEQHPAMPRSFIVGFTGLESGTTKNATCLGIVVRKVIHQHLFSYSWVQDCIDRINEEGRDMDPNEEDDEDGYNSSEEEGEGDEEDGDWGTAGDEHHDNFHLPPLSMQELGAPGKGGGGRMTGRLPSSRAASSRSLLKSQASTSQLTLDGSMTGRGNISGGGAGGGETEKFKRVRRKPPKLQRQASTASSMGGSTQVSARLGATINTARQGDTGRHVSNYATSDVNGGGVVSTVATAPLSAQIAALSTEEEGEGDNLLISERQFFDVVRMRLTETNSAEARAEAFARKLWTQKCYREDPELKVLTSINILAHLTKWYFQAMCRRLCRVCTTEAEGTKLVTESQRLEIRTMNAEKRAAANAEQAMILEGTRQPWMNSLMLSPEERKAKRIYLDTIRDLKQEARDDTKLATELAAESVRLLRRGKEMLPRMQLSVYVCNYYKLKINAARHMQSLLERMDLNTLKSSLSGNSVGGGGFSGMEMDIIRSNLRKRAVEPVVVNRLEDIVNDELKKHHARQKELKKMLRQNSMLERSGSMNRLLISIDPNHVGRGGSRHSSLGSLEGDLGSLSLSTVGGASGGIIDGVASLSRSYGSAGGHRSTGYKPPRAFKLKKRERKVVKPKVETAPEEPEETVEQVRQTLLAKELVSPTLYTGASKKSSNIFIAAAAQAMKEESKRVGGDGAVGDMVDSLEGSRDVTEPPTPEPEPFEPINKVKVHKKDSKPIIAPAPKKSSHGPRPILSAKPRKVIQVEHHPHHVTTHSTVRFDDDDDCSLGSIGSFGSQRSFGKGSKVRKAQKPASPNRQQQISGSKSK